MFGEVVRGLLLGMMRPAQCCLQIKVVEAGWLRRLRALHDLQKWSAEYGQKQPAEA